MSATAPEIAAVLRTAASQLEWVPAGEFADTAAQVANGLRSWCDALDAGLPDDACGQCAFEQERTTYRALVAWKVARPIPQLGGPQDWRGPFEDVRLTLRNGDGQHQLGLIGMIGLRWRMLRFWVGNLVAVMAGELARSE